MKNIYYLNILIAIVSNWAILAQMYIKDNHYEINRIKLFSNDTNITDFCSEKTDELLTFLLNPKNSNKTFNDYSGFLLYSSFSPNDLGDYDSCIRNEEYNYLLINLNLPVGFLLKVGLCYFKDCDAGYFAKSKSKLIAILNSKYNYNITEDMISFSNPKNNMEAYRNNSTTGFVVVSVIMGLIALLSIIKLLWEFLQKSSSTAQAKEKTNYKILTNSKDSLDNADKSCDKANNDNKSSKQKNFFLKVLDCFDLCKNVNAIFKVSNQNQTFEYLRVLDGVRVLSTGWVIWGHVFGIAISSGLKNMYDFLNKIQNWGYCILLSAILSVDVFFFLSGFLLYFNLKKYLKNASNKISFFFVSLFQRYIRLLPFYLIGIFYMTYLLPFLFSGPKTDDMFNYFESCKKYWWANLLYIQNFLDYSSVGGISCIGHTWYLCDDMIYFVCTMIIILLINKKSGIQNLIIFLLFIASIVWQIVKIIENDYTLVYKNFMKQKGNFFFDFYAQPFARITPYLLGILYCELFFHTDVYKNKSASENLINANTSSSLDNQVADAFINNTLSSSQAKEVSLLYRINSYIKSNDKLCLFIFIFSLIEINFAVFIIRLPQITDISRGLDIFLLVFVKIFFITGLGNILHLIFLGKLEFIKYFLSMTVFTRLSRVTYGIYILHYGIVMLFHYNRSSPTVMDFYDYTCFAIGLFLITSFFSFVVGIFYESPFINMLKGIRGSKESAKKDASTKKHSILDIKNQSSNA